MNAFHQSEPFYTTAIRDIQRPSSTQQLTLHSPALQVFTDFTQQAPMMLEQTTGIDDAREIMRRTHTRMFLVIDTQEDFRGVISLDDLVSEKVMKKMSSSRLQRDELTVESVMTPRNRLHAIDLKQFQQASVGDVLTRMKKYGDQYMIVVEGFTDSIRGVVSAHGIARKMHTPVVIDERAVLFSDIYNAIAV